MLERRLANGRDLRKRPDQPNPRRVFRETGGNDLQFDRFHGLNEHGARNACLVDELRILDEYRLGRASCERNLHDRGIRVALAGV